MLTLIVWVSALLIGLLLGYGARYEEERAYVDELGEDEVEKY